MRGPQSKWVAESFAVLLRAARRDAGMTQEALANLSGLDRTTISQAELAKALPELETLIRLAGALDREPAELIPQVRWEPPASFKRPEGRFR